MEECAAARALPLLLKYLEPGFAHPGVITACAGSSKLCSTGRMYLGSQAAPGLVRLCYQLAS